MSGEILADDNSPMVMTVGQYNDRVAYTWKLATEAEQERIIKLIQDRIDIHKESGLDLDGFCACPVYEYTIELIKGETN